MRILEEWTPRLTPLALYYFGRNGPPAAVTAFILTAREFAEEY
ncbi:protein of unknown function (plasmid) [Agrobacterium pusense]|uniref:LysR family transcriptional regulator n=1 Tax=Agrobacterium pusense TaxID=648995 RepID=U4Q3R8_9HYPH|nr:protein of unknown function [Agrobacterium pusense]